VHKTLSGLSFGTSEDKKECCSSSTYFIWSL